MQDQRRRENMVVMPEQDADALVARYIIQHLRDEVPYDQGRLDHIAQCPEAVVTDPDARNGSYGCDTGCEYARFTATLTCPHGEPANYDFGEFGELAYILEDLAAEG
jgi:hypothetical protein